MTPKKGRKEERRGEKRVIGVKNTIVMINSDGGETGAERRKKEGERSESVEVEKRRGGEALRRWEDRRLLD